MRILGIEISLRRKIMADCGHLTKIKDKVKAYGSYTITEIPVENGATDYCHQCLAKMAIQCAWCGKPIFIGDPVTLFTPTDPIFEIPAYAVIYCQKPLQLVGCLRSTCADTLADRAGVWYPPGEVKHLESAYGKLVTDPSQNAVIIHDMAKI